MTITNLIDHHTDSTAKDIIDIISSGFIYKTRPIVCGCETYSCQDEGNLYDLEYSETCL